jgi:nitrogen fixation-related uncharacterized protein
MPSYEDHAWARAEALSKRAENAAAKERRNEILARLIVGAIGIGIVVIIGLFVWAANEGGKPVNQYGDDPIKATVRAQYTNEAQATIDAQIYRQPTPIRVRIVP